MPLCCRQFTVLQVTLLLKASMHLPLRISGDGAFAAAVTAAGAGTASTRMACADPSSHQELGSHPGSRHGAEYHLLVVAGEQVVRDVAEHPRQSKQFLRPGATLHDVLKAQTWRPEWSLSQVGCRMHDRHSEICMRWKLSTLASAAEDPAWRRDSAAAVHACLPAADMPGLAMALGPHLFATLVAAAIDQVGHGTGQLRDLEGLDGGLRSHPVRSKEHRPLDPKMLAPILHRASAAGRARVKV